VYKSNVAVVAANVWTASNPAPLSDGLAEHLHLYNVSQKIAPTVF